MAALPPVDELSGSDNSPRSVPCKAGPGGSSTALKPVLEVSDSSSHADEMREVGLRRRKKKRKRDTPTRKSKLVSDLHCRAMLGKWCKSCRRSCLSDFLRTGKYKRFLEFREQWKDVHKLDQDKIVTRLFKAFFVLQKFLCSQLDFN